MPTHRKVSCYGSSNSSKKAEFTTSGYNTVCYVCEGRGVKIMEGEDCFRRGLSHSFKLPVHDICLANLLTLNDEILKAPLNQSCLSVP